MNNPYIKNLLDRISTILRDKFLPISVNSVYEMKFHCLCVNNLSLNEFFSLDTRRKNFYSPMFIPFDGA